MYWGKMSFTERDVDTNSIIAQLSVKTKSEALISNEITGCSNPVMSEAEKVKKKPSAS